MSHAFHRAIRRVAAPTLCGAAATDEEGGGSGVSLSRVSVMQFNVLAEKLEPSPVDPANDVSCNAVKFAQRGPLNVAHVRALNPDVLVMQEVDDPATHYGPELHGLGYTVVADRKDGGTKDCTVVAFKAARFVQASPHRVVRFGTAEVPASQFALLLHLAPVGGAGDGEGAAPDFFVVGQHAKAGRTEANEAIRVAHAKRLVTKELPAYVAACRGGGERSAADLSKCRVIFAGDMNAGPETYGGLYPCKCLPWLTNAASRNEGEPPQTAATRSSFVPGGGDDAAVVFESAMANALAADGGGSAPSGDANACAPDLYMTTCKLRDGSVIRQTIDFILFPRGAARTVAYLPCPVADAQSELAPFFLPNEHWGSDHLSVYAELEWLV